VEEPIVFRAAPSLASADEALHAEAPACVAADDLLGRWARQPSGRLARAPVDDVSRRRIPPTLKGWTHQGGAPVAIGKKLQDRWDHQPSAREARA
jgi:hypothetical protein